MPNLQVTHVTRTSVLLSWDVDPVAVAYSLRRQGPHRPGRQSPDVLLAACYTDSYCDTELAAASSYTYVLRMMPDLAASPAPPVDEESVRARTLPETEYPNSLAFFTDFLAPTFPRSLGSDLAWCEQWWRHPETRYVIDQLWASYEAMRPPMPPEPPGKHRAEWLIAYFSPLLDRLLVSKGPHEGCTLDVHENDGILHSPKSLPLPHRVDPSGEYRAGADPALTMTP